MIISNVKIVNENNWSRVQADIQWGENESKTVFIAVPSNFSDELDDTCADNFLVGLMLLAIKNDEDIYIKDSKISKTLIDNIYGNLMPALTQMGCGTGKTKIYADFIEGGSQIRGSSGATGISLGVDSFYSILRYKDSIDTVLFFREPKGDTLEFEKSVQNEFDVRKKVANELSLRFIPVLSNMVSIMDTLFVFEQYHTYHNLAVALTIKSINLYYYATAYKIEEMQPCFSLAASYDYITSKAFSHDNFSMKMSGEEVTRYQKTEFISQNSMVKNNLEVCLKFDKKEQRKFLNCSVCAKCIRTLAALEIIGSISDFNKIFDIDYYYKNRVKVWGGIEYKKIVMHDKFSADIISKAKNAKFKLPTARWLVFLSIGIKNQFEKIAKKIRR